MTERHEDPERIEVHNQLAIVQNDQAAAELFEAILRSAESARQRKETNEHHANN